MTDEELNEKFGRLVDAQLRFQDQLGDLARLMREDREDRQRRWAEQERKWAEQERKWAEQELINAESRQRHEENEQLFNILLEEIRFLIRQQHPPEEK